MLSLILIDDTCTLHMHYFLIIALLYGLITLLCFADGEHFIFIVVTFDVVVHVLLRMIDIIISLLLLMMIGPKPQLKRF